MAIVLPVRNQAGLTSLLGELYSPTSPFYRHFLSVQQFTDQFGPTEQDYQSVIQWANDNGLTITSESENRLILDVSGTAEKVNSALHVSMNLYRDPNGNRTFYSIDREPTLSLTVPVAHIQGLDNFSVPRPMFKRKKNPGPVADVTGSGPGGYYLGSDMRAAYYGGTLLTGVGQCVGLLEFGGYRLSDVNLTFNNAGQSYSVPINNVLIDGATAAAGSDDTEQVLDIVQAIGMAPGLSQVRVYIGYNGIGSSGYPNDEDIFNKMATENVCKQLSVSWSWGLVESPIYTDEAYEDGVFDEFAAQGQTLFVASGDYGAYDAAVSPYFFPAEDPNVTAVGGTHLTTNYGNGPWVAETAWNNPPYGSGGGTSPDDVAMPSWQLGAVDDSNGGSLSLRNVPDVAMEADLDSYSCAMGSCSGGIGGTSFAAPRWAGFMALVNQQAVEADTATAPNLGLGFINPILYSIGEGSNFTADFHDITSGNNDSDNQPVWYSAVTGYDLVTGWGSPNGQNLIDALAGPVVPGFWLSLSPATLSVSQNSSTTANISVLDAGGFAGNVSLTLSALPSGVTASFSPSTTSGTSVLTITADSSATLGAAPPITITGTSGTLSSTTSLFLTVNSPFTPPSSAGEFGSVNIGATSNPSALTVSFTTAGTLGSIAVLTQGVSNLDFANANGGTCAVGTAYAANATCTVNVTFTPKYAGTRNGAVVLEDASGNRLANLYLQGTGVGPQTTFIPGTQTTVGSGFTNPEATAVLGDGSFYVANYGSGSGTGAVYLEKISNGSYTQSQLGCTFTSPVGVAVDGSGTIYVADPGVPAVYKVNVSDGNCSQTTIGSGFGTPWSVAVDGSGDLYITDLGTSSIPAAVYKESLQANGTYVQSAIGSGWIEPAAVAADASGNVDVADYAVPGVFMETPSGGSYTQSAIGQGWTAPSGIAVDGNGNIYVSDSGNDLQYGGSVPAAVFKEVRSGGIYVKMAIGSGWVLPYGIAADASGNIYVADEMRGVYKDDLADPPGLGFANAIAGAISTDSPKSVTVSNIGTAALQFSSVSYPGDFPEAAGVPTDCTSSTSLAAGGSCTLSIDFLPTTALGTNTSLALNESLTITTNTLDTTAAQQLVAVSGTEVLPGGSVGLTVSSAPAAAGTPVTFTATVNSSTGGPTPTGTVTFYNGTTPIAGPLTLSNGVATYSTSGLDIGTYIIFASYSGDSNYLGSNSNSITESIVAVPGVAGFGDTSIGTKNVGSTSSAIPLTIRFNTAETLGSIAVLTEGALNLDFANAGGGTCSIGTAYAANASCTVNVTFTPKYSGTRFGAVVLSDNNGNVIGTGYLEGTGAGSQAVFMPGTLSSLASGFGYPQGIAVDGNANLYVADAISAAVYKETLTSGTYSQSVVASGFSEPYGVAVDAAGNIYVADVGNHAVYKETPSSGSYIQTVIGYGFAWPSGVAVDALGNVYVADFGNGVTPGAVYIETLSSGSYTQSPIGTGFVSPQSIAVDGSGNIYVDDSANGNGSGAVYKLMPSNGSYSQTTIGTGWVTPTGVAVDGNGNIFVTDDSYDLGDGFVVEETLQSDGGYVQTTSLENTSTPYPGGVAVDGRGNLYITDNFDGVLYRDDLADPPALSFATTMLGYTSSDSPKTVSVQNIGNASLSFSSVSYPIDFPEGAGVPTDCTSSTSLGIGVACTLTVDFTPTALSGTNQPTLLSENVSISTNSLNGGGTAQVIAVSGTEVSPTATVSLTVPANVATVGSSVTLTAVVTGESGVAAPTGSVTFYSGGTALGTSSLTNGTANYSTSSFGVGTYSITATYSGDQVYDGANSNVVTESVIPSSTFGTQDIGSSSSSSITITFSSRATLGSIAVLTQGMPNLDFTNAGGGTCTVGTTYAAKATCTVNVSFKPLYSGTRYGALVLGGSKGTLIQTIYLEGTGVGPQITFVPATQTTISSNISSTSCGMTVDVSGNVYACAPNSPTSITKWTLNNGTYNPSIVLTTSVSISAFAIDGAGNIYIVTTGSNGTVLKETLLAGTYSESTIGTSKSGWTSPYLNATIAVDGAGNIYFIGEPVGAAYSLFKYTPSSSGYVQSTVPTGPYALNFPSYLAADGAGNIYVSNDVIDSNTGILHDYIYKETPSGGSYVENLVVDSTQSAAVQTRDGKSEAFTLDGNGNIYFAGLSEVFEAMPSGGGGYTTASISNVNEQPVSLVFDGGHNIYFFEGSQLLKLDEVDPPIMNFVSTNIGTTSTDSPKVVTIRNLGNASLAVSVPSTGTNPSISPNFSLDKATTCPEVSTSGPVAALNVGSSCSYGIDFTPTASGSIIGSLVLTDNALNAVNGTQTIPLSGTGSGTGGGGAVVAMLTIGPGGVPKGVIVPNAAALDSSAYSKIWVDTHNKTLISGFVFLETDQQGQLTCNLYSQATVTATPSSPLYGALSYTTENYELSGGQCPGILFPFAVARYTWGSNQTSNQTVDQDPFVLQVRNQYGQMNEYGFSAELSHIAVTPAVQNGSTSSDPPMTATVTLENSPANATGYNWTITGGGGAVVFPNGQESMSSTNNSIIIEEPNPTLGVMTDVTLNVVVSTTTQLNVVANGAGTLDYGPSTDSFSSFPKDNGCQDCAAGDPITIGSGNVFEEVVDYETAGQNKLSYIRSYNSLPLPNTFASTLGLRWRSNYDRYLNFVSSSLTTAERPDGQQLSFHKSGGSWVSDSDIDDTLTQSGTAWTLTDHEGTVETYTQLGSSEGLPQSITLRNGYTQTLAYNSSGQLSTVTDSYGRQLAFTYANGVVSTVTTPDGLVLTYGYNSVSNPNDQLASVSYSTSPVTSQQYLYQDSNLPYVLTSIVDENGKTYESWTYDSNGRGLSSQVGGVANRTTVSYDDADMTRTVTNALGVTDTYTFSILQNVPKVTQISRAATGTTAAATETFTYDANGYLASATDWDDNQTTYVNDSHGDPTTINEGVGSSVARTTTISYDSTFAQLPDTITAAGMTTSFTYDGSGEVLTKKLTDTTTQSAPYSTNGSTRTWTYTWQNSLLASVQSPRTDVVEKTSYTYDSSGALTTTTNPLNQQTTVTSHTGGGLPLTIVDPNNVNTTLTYDPREHLLTSTTAGHETKYGYDAAENLISVTQPDGSSLTYTYDSAHRLTGTKDLFGQSTSYTLDALGDSTATKIQNSSGTVTSQHSKAFDALGRMLKDIGAAGQTSSFTYDPMGNMLSATDQATNTTQRAFDALNRLDKITDPASGITTTTYDAHDRPLSVTAPTGGMTSYVYDGFGDLIQESSANSGTAVYYYDSTGNRIKRVAATGAITQYTYDGLDRVLTMTFPSDSAENVAYTYDQSGHGSGIGRLTSVSDAAGSLSRSYDQFGNLLTDARTTGTINLTTAYSYDLANRIASVTYPSGTLVSYTRDTLGRITGVTEQPNGGTSTPVVSSVAYEPFGPYTTLTYGNGLGETRSFDQDYRLTGITDGGTSTVQHLTYGYYPTNNVQTITDAVNSGNSQSFSYDNLQRLSAATGGYGSYGYTYDNDGNRLTQTLGGVTTGYGYGTGNDMLQTLSMGGVQTQTIGYTADGRINSLSPGVQAPGGQYITSLSYNQDAQLAAVNAGSGALASYTYDGFGQRLLKTFSGTSGEIYQYGQKGMLLEETNASGVAQADYIYLNGRPIADLTPSSGTLYYLHDDMLGTPQLATDSSQSTQWKASYEPFGDTSSVSGTVTQNLRLPGQYFDSESGWNHNGFRNYLPDFGRYAEPDPLSMQGSARTQDSSSGLLSGLEQGRPGTNSYTYVDNNPANLIDPLGLQTCRCADGANGSTGWRAPDFILANINIAIVNPLTGTLIGWSGTASLDRYGHWYYSPLGVGVGKSMFVGSGSLTANWMDQKCKPSEKELHDMLTTHGFSATGGYWGGLNQSYTPGTGWATGVGIVSPQLGVSYNYSFQGHGQLGSGW